MDTVSAEPTKVTKTETPKATKAETTKATKAKAPKTSEAGLQRLEKDTKARLAAQKKVPVIIFPEGKGDNTWSGFINGVHYVFPKGKEIMVPESLAKLIKQSARSSLQAEQTEAEYQDKNLGTL